MLPCPLTFTSWNYLKDYKQASECPSVALYTNNFITMTALLSVGTVSMAAAPHKVWHFANLPGLPATTEVPNVNQWEPLK